jgi:methyl-accepting chemotaxis protein
VLDALSRLIPRIALSDAAFAARHRLVCIVLWLTLALVGVVAVVNHGSDSSPSMAEHSGSSHRIMLWSVVGATVIFGWLARWNASRRWQAVTASTGLMLGAIGMVHAGNGLTDLHFAFFVLLALAGLYQDWASFAVAVVIVAVHHMLFGLLMPEEVFSDPRAQANPIPWALLHTAFVVALVMVQFISWRFAEQAQVEASTAVEATQIEARQLLGQVAADSAQRQREALTDAASQVAERESLAARLDEMLEATAATGKRIGGETNTTMSGMTLALELIGSASGAASDDLDQAVSESTSAQQVIQELERSIANITTVAQMINAVAQQTNLLALNANIEAARAGEAGRGFGVVAEEVKSLAGQTAAATARIEATVAEVRAGAEAAAGVVGGIGAVLDRVTQAQALVKEIVQSQAEQVGMAQISLAAAAEQVAGAAYEARRAKA